MLWHGIHRWRLVLALVAIFSLAQADAPAAPPAQTPEALAFPGAQGFGARVRGGRGGRVIEVTNLDSSGPGSFQAACDVAEPRIIVFKVSGVIEGPVAVRQPFVTIAGQTAPGDGICVRRGMLRILTHNVIVRYVRSRPGDDPYGPPGDGRDGFSIGGPNARDIIVDHCSISWGMDENIDAYCAARNVTVQWCIVSEALHDSLHSDGPHSTGVLLGSSGNTMTLHHCLLAHNSGRNPWLSNQKGSKEPSVFDCRNNVFYNHGPWECSLVIGEVHVNYVGNVIKPGPDQHPTRRRGLMAKDATFANKKLYVAGNVFPGPADFVKDPWRVVGDDIRPESPPAPLSARLPAPLDTPPVTTEPAEEAYESVLRWAGCVRPVRDVIDDRIVAEVRAGDGRIIDSPKYVGGYPIYATADPPPDTDHDGMPDAWEKLHGLNPNDPADGPADKDGDGYTNVEEFLNETDPAGPDVGAPPPQAPVVVQSGNEAIRGEAARRLGASLLAQENKPQATEASRASFMDSVRRSGGDPAAALGLQFAKIPPGEIMVYKVKVILAKRYELSVREVTQAQWEAVMGTKPWQGKPAAKDGPDLPVTYVSRIDAEEFVARLNAAGDRRYRLPTQCEWIHAAQGGAAFDYGFPPPAAPPELLEHDCVSLRYRDEAGYHEVLNDFPEPVGRRKPNPYGLFNMAGNVSEWCHDWHNYQYYTEKTAGASRTDPMGPEHGEFRIVCGGNFRFGTNTERVWTFRRPHYRDFGLGFRLCRALE